MHLALAPVCVTLGLLAWSEAARPTSQEKGEDNRETIVLQHAVRLHQNGQLSKVNFSRSSLSPPKKPDNKSSEENSSEEGFSGSDDGSSNHSSGGSDGASDDARISVARQAQGFENSDDDASGEASEKADGHPGHMVQHPRPEAPKPLFQIEDMKTNNGKFQEQAKLILQDLGVNQQTLIHENEHNAQDVNTNIDQWISDSRAIKDSYNNFKEKAQEAKDTMWNKHKEMNIILQKHFKWQKKPVVTGILATEGVDADDDAESDDEDEGHEADENESTSDDASSGEEEDSSEQDESSESGPDAGAEGKKQKGISAREDDEMRAEDDDDEMNAEMNAEPAVDA